MKQLHKRFTTQEIKGLLSKYLNKEIPRKYVETILGIKKVHFFRILKQYKSNPTPSHSLLAIQGLLLAEK